MGRMSRGDHVVGGGERVSRRGWEDHLKGRGLRGSGWPLGGDGVDASRAVLLPRVVERVEVQRFVDVLVVRHEALAGRGRGGGISGGGGSSGHMHSVVTHAK